jgi:hypothetical protein
MAFTANASTFTSGLSSGDIGCSLAPGTNNTTSVTILANTQINPYPSIGIAHGCQCFWGQLATTNYLYITESFTPGGGTIIITASQLNSMAVPPPNSSIPGRYFIGMQLVMLHYSNQTYSNQYGSNQLLPNEFIIPAPPGGSLNPYGGIQTSVSFIVQPCGIPTGLSGISYQNGQVFLSWYSPSDNGGSPISNYLILYSTTGSAPWSQVYTGSANIYYTLIGLTNGVTYYFQIAAINGYCNNGTGYGPESGLFSTTTNATPATTPDQVTGVTTTSGPNAGNISVTWSAPGNGGAAISSYTLQYRISGSGSFTTITGIGTTNTIVTGLANSTTYDIRVAAVNIVGTGAYSNIVIGTTFTTPNSPTNLTGASGNAQVSLTWTAPTSNGGTPVTGYVVEYSINPSGPWTPVNTGSTATTYIVTGLTNGTLYYFRVSGVNSVGTGTPSNVISLTPSTIPGPAIITSSISCDNQQVLVTWASTSPPVDTGGSPILSYNLQYSTSLTGPWLPTPTPYFVNAPTTSYTFTGLTNGTQYYFQVAAVNVIGPGPYSAQTANSTATPSITPQPPIPITTTAITSSSIAISWTTPTGLANTGGNPITGYLIYWSQISSTGSVIPPVNSYNTTTSGTPLATTYTITNLTHATLYEIQISSISCSGVGPLSSLPNSLYSLYSLYITTASIPPSAPTNVAIAGCNTGHTNSVILTWTAPANDGGSPITNYIIYYRTTSPVGIWYTYNTNSAATTAIVTLPSSGVSYDFKVAAQNDTGAGIFSSPIVSSSSYNPPTAPTNLVATTDTNGFVVLTWTASIQDAPQTISYYVIEYKLCEFGGWITYPTTIPSPTTSETINNPNIANNVSYLYRVYAVNSCGARSPLSNTASATSYNNNAPTRLWSRFDINCSGDITSVDDLDKNMLRKAQVLQYPVVGSLQYSRATLWSMASKNQLTRKKAWASQSQEYTYPNITNINNEPGVGLRQTATSLVCWTPPPAVICNTSGSSGVPGNSTTLCFSKNAPFNNYRRPNTYSSGGTKFPVFFSK